MSVVGDVGDPGEELVTRNAQVMYELPLFEVPDEHRGRSGQPVSAHTLQPIITDPQGV